MRLNLIEDNGLMRIYELPNSERIMIALDEEYREILVQTISGDSIGKIELSSNEDFDPLYKITFMYLDGCDNRYTHRGIGREALMFLKEHSGSKIVAEEDDGLKRDDGSHLTGDGPGFVRKMRREGIIEESIL